MAASNFARRAHYLCRALAPAAVVALVSAAYPVMTAAPALAASTTPQQCIPVGTTQPLPAQQVVPLEFNQFDATLGALSNVDVTVNGTITFTVTGVTTGSTYNASNDLAVVWGPGFTPQSSGSFSPAPPTLHSNPVPPVPAGDIGIAAATPVHHDPPGTVNDVDTYTNLTASGQPSDLTAYAGTSTVELDAESDGSMITTGSGLAAAPTAVTAQVCLAYEYLPAVLPEAPVALFLPLSAAAVGAGGIVLARRRRRAAF